MPNVIGHMGSTCWRRTIWLVIASIWPSLVCGTFICSPRRARIRSEIGARGSTSFNGDFERNGLFASSTGFPSLGDGFPNIGSAVPDGFPSLGEVKLPNPRRGVLVQNMAADSDHEIRIIDKDHKLGITAIVETIAIIKDARFAVCRVKDIPAAILDEFIFPIDVDSYQMAPLIRKANEILIQDELKLQWTANTLTVKGIRRPSTAYLSWKQGLRARQAKQGKLVMKSSEEEVGEGGRYGYAFQSPMTEEDMANLDRMDAAFFADVDDEDYERDAAEGLDQRQPLPDFDMLCEFEHNRQHYRVVTYREPGTVLAQWMYDGTWRLLRSVEAELVEDAIAYKQLQNIDVERIEA